MKFNQLMKKIGYNTVVNVYRVTSIYEIMPGTEDTLLVLIEGVSNED